MGGLLSILQAQHFLSAKWLAYVRADQKYFVKTFSVENWIQKKTHLFHDGDLLLQKKYISLKNNSAKILNFCLQALSFCWNY